ncbi:MAG: hypothetical protein GVY14_10365 [Spirochaetes bacterium]|nr:hypothetical protein [Spirochaetota bacterium]
MAALQRQSGGRGGRLLPILLLLVFCVGLPVFGQETRDDNGGRGVGRDPRVSEPGRRILVGMEWTALIPALDLWPDVNNAFVPSFSLGYADLFTEGLNAYAGLGYWYLTGEEDPSVGGHIFPVYVELEYSPLRAGWTEAGISLQAGAARTDIVKRGNNWEKREEGLTWLGYAAAGPILTLNLGSFVRLHTGARWKMLMQPDGFGHYVGIPLGIRVRL